MQYKIIRYARKTTETIEEALVKFEKEINDLLAEGWQIFGGIAVENGVFYQAMVNVN